jgi:hypothetical protein
MVNFQTKNPYLGNFWRVLQWKMLVYFMDVRYILQPLVYFMDIWYRYIVQIWYICIVAIWYISAVLECCTKKNLATLLRRHRSVRENQLKVFSINFARK